MAKQTISTGNTPGDGTGDTLPSAFGKVNANFDEIYEAVEGKAATDHEHAIEDVTGLQGALDAKLNANDASVTNSRTPTGGAGGVLSGTYPDPGFAVNMATQAELEEVEAAKENALGNPASDGQVLASATDGTRSWITAGSSLPRGYIAGFNLTNFSHPNFRVQPGAARDSTNTADIVLSAYLQKSYNNTWSAGANGGALDTGTISTTTWLHIFVILNPETSAVDVLASLSRTAPTLPEGFTKFRRVGTVRVTGMVGFVSTVHDGRRVYFATPQVVSGTTIGTSAAVQALTAPPLTKALFTAICWHSSSSGSVLLGTGLSAASANISVPNFDNGSSIFFHYVSSTILHGGSYFETMLDASSQIRVKGSTSSISSRFVIYGWEDPCNVDD